MSLPVVTLAYDGTAINTSNPVAGIYFDAGAALLTGVELKGTDSVPAGAPGVFARPRLILRRAFVLPGIITGADSAAYYDNWATVVALFDLTDHGNLVATLPNGDVYTLDCRPINIIPNEIFSDILAQPTVEFQSYEGADWQVGS